MLEVIEDLLRSLYGQVYSVALVGAQLLGDLNKSSLTNQQQKLLNVRSYRGGPSYQVQLLTEYKPQVNSAADPFVVNGDIAFGVAAGGGQNNIYGYNSSKKIDYLAGFSATDIQRAPGAIQYKLLKTERPPSAEATIFLTSDLANFKEGSLTISAVENTVTGTAVTLLANYAFSAVVRKNITTTLYETVEGAVEIQWQATEGSTIEFAIRSDLTFQFSVSVNASWANPAGGVSTTIVIPAFATGSATASRVVGTLTNIAKPIDKINIALYSTDTSAAFVKRILDAMYN